MSKKTNERLPKLHQAAVSVTLSLFGLFVLAIGARALYLGEDTKAVTGLSLGLLFLLASTIDRFELLKGFGIEAKLKLDQKLKEADELFGQLRQVTSLVGQSLVELHSKAATGSPQERIQSTYERIQEIRKVMEASEIKQDFIRQTLSPWMVATAHALWGHFATRIHAELRNVQGRFRSEPIENFQERDDRDRRIAEIEQFIGSDPRPMSQRSVSDYIQRLKHLQSSPYVSPEYLRTIIGPLTKAADELQYLNDHLDFRDKAFWFNLPQL